jgi:hypothetical protein
MPSRKQRRRRQKERRHEYEYVYVDDEGHEVEVDPAEVSERADTTTKRNGARQTGTRAARPVQPPSWRRVIKRAAIFFPLFFIAFSVVSSSQPVAARISIALLYSLLFMPFMYLMDRAMYRSYLKRTGKLPATGSKRR